ncbi:hypothetical protein LGM42_32370 [Burkholderia sp. AU39826]|uniref:hypothetical protein n=1 Tax=Burkholderia sp. AU39826 TaxID=2879634 RepID=UPI001CF1309C|nr:hypothetical protein [Burkholderia sp. AU39826]MCA7974573.1 hypothetical protein [Burkholderia sp. AU39826]
MTAASESVMPDLLNETERPTWFSYPRHFVRAVDLNILNLDPWQLLEGKWLRVRLEGLAKRYPDRQLVPFFRDTSSDDIACWETGKGERVQIVHDFASPGWECAGEFENFLDWYKATAEIALDFE